jgi:DNA invertase Pin-like site-specific DNA recombinase
MVTHPRQLRPVRLPAAPDPSLRSWRCAQASRFFRSAHRLTPDGEAQGAQVAASHLSVSERCLEPGYARVSTLEQNADLQRDALAGAGCWRVFTDHVSGYRDRRPQLDLLLGQLRSGDTLVVSRLDRLGRSLRHLIDITNDLAEREVGFRSLTENIDTTTAGGRLIFHVFGALAQFERELVRERTLAGLHAARARGRHGGRPTIMTPDKLAAARRMYEQRELSGEQIARALGVSRSTLYRALTKAGAVRPAPIPGSERER